MFTLNIILSLYRYKILILHVWSWIKYFNTFKYLLRIGNTSNQLYVKKRELHGIFVKGKYYRNMIIGEILNLSNLSIYPNLDNSKI